MTFALMEEDGDSVGAVGGSKLLITVIPTSRIEAALVEGVMQALADQTDDLGVVDTSGVMFINLSDPEMVKIEMRFRR
jgi:hypothetical protein